MSRARVSLVSLAEELKQIKPDLRDQFYKRDRRMAFDPTKEEKKSH